VEQKPEEAPVPHAEDEVSLSVASPSPVSERRFEGDILNMNKGYGFIRSEAFPSNIFFHWNNLSDCDFNDLKVGTEVSFVEGKGSQGPIALDIRTKTD
jgi:cold shock CspA family protein